MIHRLIAPMLTVSFIYVSTAASAQLLEPTVESLRQYQCPQWFRDTKLGIYAHWNAQGSAKTSSNGWYALYMYTEEHPAYEHHLKQSGHPSEVGYKDVIEQWEADAFDAQEWASLFKKAGTQYIVCMAGPGTMDHDASRAH